MDIPQELLQAVTSMLVRALQASAADEIASNPTNSTGILSSQRAKIPKFSMAKSNFRKNNKTTLNALIGSLNALIQLSNISDYLYANYARVHMGT